MNKAPDPFGSPHWPEEIRLEKAEKRLDITFDNGRVFRFPAEFLRVESPSAEVQGHGGEDKKIIPGKRHVGITGVEPVGHYAIRITFDDGHDTGLFSWRTLYEMGENQELLWAEYLVALEGLKLSRD